jgi:hypothetical protein
MQIFAVIKRTSGAGSFNLRNMRVDLYTLFIAFCLFIAGTYSILNRNQLEDPSLNLKFGVISITISVVIVILFIRQGRNKK